MPERIDQPCAFWDRCCTIYAARPAACRKYRCELLAKLGTGELDLSAALRRVQSAIELRGRFIDVLPDTAKVKDTARNWREQPVGERNPAQVKAMLDYVAYRLFVERHFLGPKQQWVTECSAPSSQTPPP